MCAHKAVELQLDQAPQFDLFVTHSVWQWLDLAGSADNAEVWPERGSLGVWKVMLVSGNYSLQYHDQDKGLPVLEFPRYS